MSGPYTVLSQYSLRARGTNVGREMETSLALGYTAGQMAKTGIPILTAGQQKARDGEGSRAVSWCLVSKWTTEIAANRVSHCWPRRRQDRGFRKGIFSKLTAFCMLTAMQTHMPQEIKTYTYIDFCLLLLYGPSHLFLSFYIFSLYTSGNRHILLLYESRNKPFSAATFSPLLCRHLPRNCSFLPRVG